MEPARKNLQSAMEYLMTYGWSILIVAVVLGALAYLGVFNPLYFAPKANPGSCQVFRPNGAGTSYDINLLGVCQSEVPEYVAQFNGQSSYVKLPSGQALLGTTPTGGTITAWVALERYPYGNNLCCSGYGGIVSVAKTTGNGYPDGYDTFAIGIMNNSGDISGQHMWWDVAGSSGTWGGTNGISTVIWVFVALSFEGSTGNAYLNSDNVMLLGTISGMQLDTNPSYIGKWMNGGFIDGYISDVQIYNTSLDSASVNALYQEGIGGAPIDLKNLVGWWPLNGNANDYSGNGNNGVPTNVVYTSSWISSYNPP